MLDVDWLVEVEEDVELVLVEELVELEVLEVEVVVSPLAGLTAIVAAAQNLLLSGVKAPGSSEEAANSLVEEATLQVEPPLEAPLLTKFE